MSSKPISQHEIDVLRNELNKTSKDSYFETNTTTTETLPCEHKQDIRANRVCDALETVKKYQAVCTNQSHSVPSDKLLDSIEELIIELAADNEIAWPRSSWPFLVHASQLGHEIVQRTKKWRNPATVWQPSFWTTLDQMHACIETLLNPPRPPAPNVVEREPVEQLVKEGVSLEQIAKIYDLYTTDGQPDEKRVKRIIEGKENPPPTEKVYPPKFEGSESQPSLNPIVDLARRFTKERKRAMERSTGV